MVCSSTLSAMAVIHSAKRGKPRRGEAHAKDWSRACPVDQVRLASVMMRRLCRGQLGREPPGRFRPGDATYNTVRPIRYLCSYTGKLLAKEVERSQCAEMPGMPCPRSSTRAIPLFGRIVVAHAQEIPEKPL